MLHPYFNIAEQPTSNLLCVCRVFGTTSYYVQKLFAEHQGVRYIESTISTPDHDPRDHGIAASATCQDERCTQIAFKVSLPCDAEHHKHL